MENKINELSRELAWTISNAIIDSRDKELGTLSLSILVKIRDIIEEESKSLISDMIVKRKEINDILDKI
jgi:hypothetical protein